MTVRGPVSVDDLTIALTHEHILVDQVGAQDTGYERWDRQQVIEAALPHIQQVKEFGCNTLFECTPAFMGRDPRLLKMLAEQADIHIVTNTGYYGAADHRYLPPHAVEEGAEQLAGRWTLEWRAGIEDTGITPGFMKLGVDGRSLNDVQRKLLRAAALTHLETGMTIALHSGLSAGVFEGLALLAAEGVSPGALIWVHAQQEPDLSKHAEAAGRGAWISYDGLNDFWGVDPADKDLPTYVNRYVRMLQFMKSRGRLSRVLLSNDAGWYSAGVTGGGTFTGYTAIFTTMIPALQKAGFTEEEIDLVVRINPKRALAISLRSLAP